MNNLLFERQTQRKFQILECPRLISQYRNRGVPTDAPEVKSVLGKVDSMVGEAEFSVKIN